MHSNFVCDLLNLLTNSYLLNLRTVATKKTPFISAENRLILDQVTMLVQNVSIFKNLVFTHIYFLCHDPIFISVYLFIPASNQFYFLVVVFFAFFNYE